MPREEHKFYLRQGGIVVASASGTNLKDVVREACHYVAVYSQDGPVTVTGSEKFMRAFKDISGAHQHI